MLILITLVAAYGGWRALRGAKRSFDALPQRNEDMVFF